MYYGVCYRFTDDFGDEVYPCKLSYNSYMARYYFFLGHFKHFCDIYIYHINNGEFNV